MLLRRRFRLIRHDGTGNDDGIIINNDVDGPKRKDAFGAVLDFDDLNITGSVNEGIRVDSCSGNVKGECSREVLQHTSIEWD